MHANRTGDLDPYAVPYLMRLGLSMDECLEGLARRGGLLGISGVSNDLRQVQEAAEAGNARAKLAVDMFVNQIVRYAGAFTAELGGAGQPRIHRGHRREQRRSAPARLLRPGLAGPRARRGGQRRAERRRARS